MKLQNIKIGARTYKIKTLSNDMFDQLLIDRNVPPNDLVDAKSFIDYDNELIVIRASLSSAHQRELLLHELLHAWIDDSGFVQDEHVERFIAALAPRINESFEQLFQLI